MPAASTPAFARPTLTCSDGRRCLSVLAVPLWSGIRRSGLADNLHLVHFGTDRCPTRHAPYGPSDPVAERMLGHPHCRITCLDAVHDLYRQLHLRLHGALASGRLIDNLEAWLCTAATNSAIDQARSLRIRHGALARPVVTRGVPAAAAAELDDPWLVRLLELMLAVAGAPGRGALGGWPLDWLATRKATSTGCPLEVGSAEARAEIAADIRTVLDAVEAVEPGWSYAHLLVPLRNRGTVILATDDDGLDAVRERLCAPADELTEDATYALREMADLLDRGLTPVAALVGAVRRWFGDEHPATAALLGSRARLRRLAESLAADLATDDPRRAA